MIHNKLVANVLSFVTNLLSAGVDLESGVEQITQRVTGTIKGVTPLVFAVIAGLALVFTLFKAVQALLSHRQGQPTSAVPVIVGAIATVICGLLSTSAFFGWFGL